jgi:hypothetical protein
MIMRLIQVKKYNDSGVPVLSRALFLSSLVDAVHQISPLTFTAESEDREMKFRKLMVSLLLVSATALPMTSANAFFGGWGPWDWFDDDDYYHHGPRGYPGYGYGGYPGYGYGGYPGYGYGGYPGYGYGGYPGSGYGGYPGSGGWGPFSGW